MVWLFVASILMAALIGFEAGWSAGRYHQNYMELSQEEWKHNQGTLGETIMIYIAVPLAAIGGLVLGFIVEAFS